MSDETELKITIEPDLDEEVQKAPVVVEPKKSAEPAVDELKTQVETLTEARENERQRREQAERRARELELEADQARQRASDSDLSTITTALESAQTEIEQSKKDMRAAKEAGDIDAETDALDRLTTAKATLMRLDEAKADAEVRKKSPPKREQKTVDPVEAYAEGRTPSTADWIRKHPEYVTDASKNLKLTAAHYAALAEGYQAASAKYFQHVEEFLGLTSKAGADEPAPKPAPKKAASAPVAPTAATANGGTAPDNAVSLTAREARSATDGTLVWNWDDPKGKFKKGDPIGHQEMARRKQKMMASGVYDKSYTDS